VVGLALDPATKVFATRLADRTGDDRAWIESFCSLLANKLPSAWNDDDRGRFLLRLRQLASSFRAVEALVVAPSSGGAARDVESIRIAVVGTAFAQAE